MRARWRGIEVHSKTDLLLCCLSFLPGIHLRVKGGSTHANMLVDAAVTDLPQGSVALRPQARGKTPSLVMD